MPIIVDREAVRMEILLAFQRCIDVKPLDKISLRDIAAEAGMSHPKLLNYFASRDDIVLSYVRYVKDFMSDRCRAWFAEHRRAQYGSNLDYLNAFMEYVANGKPGETRPNATTQTYVLAHYSPEVAELVKAEFREWRETMEQCLIGIYGAEAGRAQAEAMMILIAGTFICNYNRALTGEINHNILGCLSELARS